MNETGSWLERYYELLLFFEDHVQSGFCEEHEIPSLQVTLQAANPREELEKLNAEIMACTRCNLCHNRLKAVPGEGAFDPSVMVIGEAPGADEDVSGRPFVGKAGQYLDKWLASVNCSREQNCYITNIVKCRPPENRDPRPDETGACLPFLMRQIALISPQVILAVGRVSSQTLLGETRGIGALRGGSFFFHNLPLVPTYHPAAVLRDLSLRAPVWEDLKRLKALIEHAKVL